MSPGVHDHQVEGSPVNMENTYLCKVLLFTYSPVSVARQLKDILGINITINSINTIGLFPLVARTETDLGPICINVWVINNNSRFASFREGYFSGASHSIILCTNDETDDEIHELYNLSPEGITTTIVQKNTSNQRIIEENVNDFFEPDNQNNENQLERDVYFKQIPSLTDFSVIVNHIGSVITREIIEGDYETYNSTAVKTRKKILEDHVSYDKIRQLVTKMGYELENGKVKTFYDDILFEIDFYRNSVRATMVNCLDCDMSCKHTKKLCVVVEEKGFSNIGDFANLRALAILYAIKDKSFFSLTGKTKSEDINYQLKKLRTMFETNCPYYKTDEKFSQKEQEKKKFWIF